MKLRYLVTFSALTAALGCTLSQADDRLPYSVCSHRKPHPTSTNPDCSLIVPFAPLTAAGLATPYQLVATDPAKGACVQGNADQSAFVQAAILDPATGQISIYSPLVITQGTEPAAPPVRPNLPANAVVALWFGFNGDELTLSGNSYNLEANRCVNGLGNSVFGQFAYCNAPAFFTAANVAIRSGRLVIPSLGVGADGQQCPTSRSYAVIDQDPSDNVQTEYLDINGRTAQVTAANLARFPGARRFGNPSDERLVSNLLDPALSCRPATSPNLADPGGFISSLAMNELQAAAFQQAPVALIPLKDPMTLVNGYDNLAKMNAYRIGVGQPRARSVVDADPVATCRNLRSIAPASLLRDRAFFSVRPSPFPLVTNSLLTFMANRYVASYQILDCQKLLGQPVNVTLTTDTAGVVVDATFQVGNAAGSAY